MRTRRIVGGLTAVIISATGCSGSDDAMRTTTSATTASTAATTSSTMSSRTTPSSTTSTITTTTSPATGLITRPYVDPAVCGPGAKAEHEFLDFTWFPFAVTREAPIPLQVFASHADGVAKPFAVVLRASATTDVRANDHPVSINGVDVSITIWSNGNGQAAWTLADGTWAYLRARDLDETALVALIARLTPRDRSAAIPGFDLAPSSGPDDLVLLHEHLNTGLSGTLTRFQCTTDPNNGIFHIDVIQGDPVSVYLGILDRPRPDVVGVNGGGAITIESTWGDTVLTLADIVEADPATWDALPEIGPFGSQPA